MHIRILLHRDYIFPIALNKKILARFLYIIQKIELTFFVYRIYVRVEGRLVVLGNFKGLVIGQGDMFSWLVKRG